jgi:hypothetical protein
VARPSALLSDDIGDEQPIRLSRLGLQFPDNGKPALFGESGAVEIFLPLQSLVRCCRVMNSL